MADRKDFFRQMAAQYRQLAEIASNPEIKQRMLDMAAHYQAKADEDEDAEQSSGRTGRGLLAHALEQLSLRVLAVDCSALRLEGPSQLAAPVGTDSFA
jgi:hypothetical protein